jgi:AcrR family transcriptional regulator
MVGVVPNAAYRHFADREELLAAVCTAAMHELAARMAAGVARARGKYGDPAAARRRLRAIGRAYLEFATEEPGLFATAFALPDPPSPREANFSLHRGGPGMSQRPYRSVPVLSGDRYLGSRLCGCVAVPVRWLIACPAAVTGLVRSVRSARCRPVR